MSRKQQVVSWIFIMALVGTVSFTASTYLGADEQQNPLAIPVPLPVVSAAPLQVTAPQPLPVTAPAPLPVTGTVNVVLAPVHWEYKVLDVNGMLGNFPPGFGYWPQEHQTTKYNLMAADGWEFVGYQNLTQASSQHVWVWRRPVQQ